MALLTVRMFTSILGTMVELKQISEKDRWERKKYMAVWRRESELTARMMSRFQCTETRYMDKNRTTRRAAGLDPLRGPGGRSQRHLLDFVVPFVWTPLEQEKRVGRKEASKWACSTIAIF